jgi:hypothetical protein
VPAAHLNAGNVERRHNPIEPRGARTVQLADLDLDSRGQLHDRAVIVELHGDPDGTADHRGPKPSRKCVFAANAVEERRDDRVRSHGRGDIVHHLGESVGLHSEQDQVVRRGELIGSGHSRPHHLRVMAGGDTQTELPQ